MIVHPINLRMGLACETTTSIYLFDFFQGILSSYRQTVYHDHFYVDIFLISFFSQPISKLVLNLLHVEDV